MNIFTQLTLGLDRSFYTNKVILDIGCEPRGSLDWASMTSRRIGLDLPIRKYLQLGANQHGMEYLDAASESVPLPDAQCDVVCAFNSLDHVECLTRTATEKSFDVNLPREADVSTRLLGDKTHRLP